MVLNIVLKNLLKIIFSIRNLVLKCGLSCFKHISATNLKFYYMNYPVSCIRPTYHIRCKTVVSGVCWITYILWFYFCNKIHLYCLKSVDLFIRMFICLWEGLWRQYSMFLCVFKKKILVFLTLQLHYMKKV